MLFVAPPKSGRRYGTGEVLCGPVVVRVSINYIRDELEVPASLTCLTLKTDDLSHCPRTLVKSSIHLMPTLVRELIMTIMRRSKEEPRRRSG